MRRSTRTTIKRTSLSPDSSEEDEPKKIKPGPKLNKNAKPGKESQEGNFNNESNIESSTSEQKTTNWDKSSDDSSSESDIENYMQPVDEIDLDSTFFQTNKTNEKNAFEDIEKNIFSGINRLSDSESEPELEGEENTKTKKAETKNSISYSCEATTSKINFQQLHEYTTKIEEAKKLVEKYEAGKRAKQRKSANKKSEDNMDVSDLLALGEAKVNSSTDLQLYSSDFESHSESEKEDWEEVQHHDIKESNDNIIPKDGVQITLEIPGGVMRKKKGIDLIACMKRRLNKIKKENQVYVHKVHLLCWLGHGNYVNQVLNNESLLGLALSLIPSQHCYPSERTDLNYLEQIVKWYKNSMPIVDKLMSKKMTLEKALQLQINRRQAINKKMSVYIFICILRSLGIQCRLVISFQVAPLRPPTTELHSLSTKSENKNEKDAKPSTSKKVTAQKADDTKVVKNDKTNKKPDMKGIKSIKPNLENLNKKDNQNTKNKIDNRQLKKKEISASTKSHLKANNVEANDVQTKEQKLKNKSNSSLNKNKDYTKASTSTNKTSQNIEIQSKDSKNKIEKQLGKLQYYSKNLHPKKEEMQKNNDEVSTVKIPQVDGADDSDELTASQQAKKPNLKKLSEEEANSNPIKKHPKRFKSLSSYRKMNSNEDVKFQSPKMAASTSTQSNSKANLKKLNKKSIAPSTSKNLQSESLTRTTSSTNLRKLKQKSISNKEKKPTKPPENKNRSQYFSHSLPTRHGGVHNDIIAIMKGRMVQERALERARLVKSRKAGNESDYDSDYAPEAVKKKQPDSDDEFYEESKVKVKQRVKVKKEEDEEETKVKKGVDVWIEVYLEAEEKWISADVIKGKVHCIKELYSKASHPVTYIVAWNNDNSIKDITQRYCPNWNTVTRKLRIDRKWWEDSLRPFEGRKTARDREEDEELARLQLDQPLPTAISEYKNHPLYVLKRHLLKFEALYPPLPITLGFIKGEAVYSRECVHTLHSREVWIKYAKVVKPEQEPYKIVKARAKYDKLSGQVVTDQPLELFGKWQVGDYVPPVAENGVVPRNAYGNVELFKACMLPKGTVHLQLPGLNKLAKRMNIDCAPAVVGFDFHAGGSHPTFDGFVVCEEHSESMIAAWYMEREEQEKKEKEKIEKRIYGNWKKLIRGLLIRERLKARYNFGGPSKAGTKNKKREMDKPKLMTKKRRLYSESESE